MSKATGVSAADIAAKDAQKALEKKQKEEEKRKLEEATKGASFVDDDE